MEDAAIAFKAAGTNVIISSQTPSNPFRDHTGATPVHVLYAKAVAEKAGVAFLDHFSFTRDEYLTLGAAAVNEMLPSDGVHTTLAGAEVAARSFVRATLCAGQMNPLYPYVSVDSRLVSSFLVMGEDDPLTPPVACTGNLETETERGYDLSGVLVAQPLSARGVRHPSFMFLCVFLFRLEVYFSAHHKALSVIIEVVILVSTVGRGRRNSVHMSKKRPFLERQSAALIEVGVRTGTHAASCLRSGGKSLGGATNSGQAPVPEQTRLSR